MNSNLRTELIRQLALAGKRWPAAMVGWPDQQVYRWFNSYHPSIYRRVLGLPPRLEVVR
jgi:hypothetical protein